MWKSSAPWLLAGCATMVIGLLFYWFAGPGTYAPDDPTPAVELNAGLDPIRDAGNAGPGARTRDIAAAQDPDRPAAAPRDPATTAGLPLLSAAGADIPTTPSLAGGVMIGVAVGVLDPISRTPMSGVRLTIQRKSNPEIEYVRTTNEKGVSWFTGIKTGEFDVHAGILGMGHELVGTILIVPDVHEYWVVYPGYESVTITVLDADDQPVPDFNVRTEARWPGGGGILREYTTDEQGVFVAGNFQPRAPFYVAVAEEAVIGPNRWSIEYEEIGLGVPDRPARSATIWASRVIPFAVCFGIENASPEMERMSFDLVVNSLEYTLWGTADCFIVPRAEEGIYEYTLSTFVAGAGPDSLEIPQFVLKSSFAADAQEETMHIVIDMQGQRDVEFEVVTESGAKVEGLPLVCQTIGTTDDSMRFERSEMTIPSDAAGIVYHALPDSLETLRIGLAPNPQFTLPREFIEFERAGLGDDPIRIVVQARPAIEGMIVDAEGAPVPGMHVVALTPDFTVINLSESLSGPDGGFDLFIESDWIGQTCIVVATTANAELQGLIVRPGTAQGPASIVVAPRGEQFFAGLRPEQIEVRFVTGEFSHTFAQENENPFISIRAYDEEEGGTRWSHIEAEYFEAIAPQ